MRQLATVGDGQSETVVLRLISRLFGTVSRSTRRVVGTRSTLRHLRRRLARRWEAEAVECRCLLTNVLGGNVFTPVDYIQIPNFDVAGTTLLGDQVVVHGTNANGHGEVARLRVTDAVFSNLETLTFLSEYEKANPGADSLGNVAGA